MEKTYERCKTCKYSDLKEMWCDCLGECEKTPLIIDGKICSKFKEKMEVNQSVYRANIIEKLDKQIQKGIDKYGTTLEQNTWFTAMDRLTYLQEELIDGLVYIEHIMAKLKELNIELD